MPKQKVIRGLEESSLFETAKPKDLLITDFREVIYKIDRKSKEISAISYAGTSYFAGKDRRRIRVKNLRKNNEWRIVGCKHLYEGISRNYDHLSKILADGGL